LDSDFLTEGNKTIKASAGLEWIMQLLEYLAGEVDEPPVGLPLLLKNWWFWTLWWAAMALLIFAFSGQSSKFIYIDF
jgi:hypothetical protein